MQREEEEGKEERRSQCCVELPMEVNRERYETFCCGIVKD